MGILLAFAPFIAFAIFDRLVGSIAGLTAGVVVSAILLGRDFAAGKTPKILEACTLASMALGHPFTIQYAREQVAREFWDRPEFLRTHHVITAAWAVAFALMVSAEFALLYVPPTPHRLGVLVIIAALVGAVKFSSWYPDRAKTRTNVWTFCNRVARRDSAEVGVLFG
jgi:hypothetical protein